MVPAFIRSIRRSIWRVSVICIAVHLGADIRPAHATPTGAVAGKVQVRKDGKPRGNHSRIVVYLESVPAPALAPAASRERPQIRQRDQRFDPEQVVVMKGEAVDFPNEDKVFHNVFSVSEAASFDLGLYKQGSSKSVTLKRAGVVDIFCNIHPDMVAKIKVLDTPYYAVTTADGSFRIDKVPPGTYPIVAWQAWGAPFRGQVTVAAGGTATAPAIVLEEGEPSKRHVRKDGTPYGRYK